MNVSAQISIFPLRQEHVGPAVEGVRLALESRGLEPAVGPMSTVVAGEPEQVFAALRDAFERAASTGDVAMVFTVSNACALAERRIRDVGDL